MPRLQASETISSNGGNYGSFGSHGSYSGMSSGTSCFTIDICPDLLIAIIAAAAAGAFFFLYQAITVAGRKKRRKRRNIQNTDASIVFDLAALGKLILFDGKLHYLKLYHRTKPNISTPK